MGSRELLSLSVPFLSTKSPSEMVTGEMGSGFLVFIGKHFWLLLKRLGMELK